MRDLYGKIDNVAASSAPVFITGETGTGKEVCAQAVHSLGNRADGPFVPVNCGAIPHDLMESEMFGHLKGAFTGAIAHRDGAAKAADGGTLFLDEICELPLDLQSKLLRFLQTGYIQPVGAARPQKVDVRIICATNKDPQMEVAEGRFRQDLYYRLFVLPLKMPALRVRGADVELVATYFLKQFSAEEGKRFERFSHEALLVLDGHDWPGNIRELQNAIRQIVVMNDGDEVQKSMLGALLSENQHIPDLDISAFTSGDGEQENLRSLADGNFPPRRLWQIERDAIEAAIVGCQGSVPKAAEKLGVSPSTIYRKRESWNNADQAM